MNNFPIQHGLKRIYPDHRRYSFPRTFGAIAPAQLPTEDFDYDPHLTTPDQNADGNPEECVVYTTKEVCQDEDQTIYTVDFLKKKMMFMTGQLSGPYQLTDGLKTAIVYGVQEPDETTDTQAFQHHRGQYFQGERTNGLDFFDAIRSTLHLNRFERRSVSIGTLWMPEFENIGPDGIVPGDFAYNGNSDDYPGHNWKISGQKTINGIIYLIGKTWEGAKVGDKGFKYFPRNTINKALSIPYTGFFTVAKASQENIQVVELTILQQIVSYYRLMLKNLGLA